MLGPYFKASDKKPNVVLIISKSLSSSFCGKYGQLGDLTPFLDSLIENGLYWRNFISNAERSYGALPNILASLPYGSRRGFNQLYENNTYPTHTSLLKILKKNNYSSSFYYGGWAYFDKMGNFLDYNGIDKNLSHDTFDKNRYDSENGVYEGVTWGYNDKDLFEHVIETIDTFPKNKSYLSIITTISLHTPYNMCTQNYYDLAYLKKTA